MMDESSADAGDAEVRINLLVTEVVRYRTVFDGAQVGLAETDAQGVVRLANAALTVLLGVPRHCVIGKPLINFVARADTRAFRSAVQAMAERGQHEAFVVRFRPRRRAPPFPAEVLVCSARGRLARCFVWTIRAVKDAGAAEPLPGAKGLSATTRGAEPSLPSADVDVQRSRSQEDAR
jgi:PAS domain S-box-containing protein